MRINITFAAAQARHPNLVQGILRKIVKGKSKAKRVASEELSWGYDWCVRIDAAPMNGPGGFFEAIMGQEERTQDFEKLTDAEALADFKGRCGISLVASYGKATWYSDSSPDVFPNEIEEQFLDGRRTSRQEKERYDKLTPEQKNQEFNDAIKKLKRSPGFVMFNVPVQSRE